MKLSVFLGAILAFASCAFGDSTAYITTGSQQFGMVDLNTGAINYVGFTSGLQLAGLGEVGGVIYGGSSDTLYRVNTSTGALTSIGTTPNFSYYVFGSTDTALYTVDQNSELWSIDRKTGVISAVGNTGVLLGGNTVGLSAGYGSLYMTVANGLYTIDTVTGTASFVGNTGTQIGGLIESRGKLYAGSDSDFAVYQLNWKSGAGTLIAGFTGDPTAVTWGLAPVVPEPASYALMSLAGLAFAVYSMTRKRAA